MPDAGPFSGDTENVIRWLATAGALAGIAGIALLVTALVRGSGWRGTPVARWMLLVGLLFLPLATLVPGNIVGFHQTRQSCASCHTMDPWIQDMKNPESTTLASLHHRNRWINKDSCYTCHSGYGLAGNFDAKMSGLEHVVHYYITGVPEEIRHKGPYPFQTCLSCHVDAASYTAVEIHEDPEIKPKILSGETSCFECHASPHPRKAP